MKEIWKNIEGFNNRYQISNLGNIKRINYKLSDQEKILKPVLHHTGYLSILLNDGELHKRYNIHRLVAQYFVSNPHNKPQVNHKDGNKLHNHAANLEWVTQLENMRHARVKGLYPNKRINKLSYEDQIYIITYATKNNKLALANQFNVSKGHISNICTQYKQGRLKLNS